MAGRRETLGRIRPQGGMTAFPWLVNEENATHFCQAAAEQGILLAPGDCFDVPSHFRLGFAATGHKFPQALDRFGEFVKDLASEDRKQAISIITDNTIVIVFAQSAFQRRPMVPVNSRHQ
jgi:hypothetical protein